MTAAYRALDRVSRRMPSLAVRDAQAELDKLGLLRILVGIVALIRVIPVAWASRFYFDQTPPGMLLHPAALGVIVAVLLIAMTLGIATPLTLITLILVYGEFDAANQTRTLGSNILLLLLLLLLFAGAGQRRSIDAVLLRRDGRARAALRRLYALTGRLTETDLRVLYLLFFVAFATISLGAVLLHVGDSYWREGYTLEVMFTSSYLSRVYVPVRELQARFPEWVRATSAVGGLGQALFQLFMLPLMLTRAGGRFVVLWGLAFFLSSALFLELSYLPYLELLLWGALFLRVPSSRPIEIFYDDYCNLCSRTVRVLRAINVLGTVAFRPASLNHDSVVAHGIPAADLASSLLGVFAGRVYRGYGVYELLAQRNPLLWVFAPLLWIGRMVRVGPWMYGVVARNRRRMFGTCKVAYDVNALPTSTPIVLPPAFDRLGHASVAMLILVALTVVYRFPGLRGLHGEQRSSRVVTEGLYRLGFDVPDVFNSTDLRMGDQWPVIYRGRSDGTFALVPMHDVDGRKLMYPRRIDILYFGNSLRWRRGALAADPVAYSQPAAAGYALVARVIAFDHRWRGTASDLTYRIEILRHDGTDVTRPSPARYSPRSVYSYTVVSPAATSR